MRSFADYRKIKIQNNFPINLKSSINAQFDIFRYDLLESIKLPELLFENNIEYNVLYKQQKKEDYKQLSIFVEELIRICKSNFYNNLLIEAEEVISDPYADFQAELLKGVEDMFKELKASVTAALKIVRDQGEDSDTKGQVSPINVSPGVSSGKPSVVNKSFVSPVVSSSPSMASAPSSVSSSSPEESDYYRSVDTNKIPVTTNKPVVSPQKNWINTDDVGNPSTQSILDLVNKKRPAYNPLATHTDVVSPNPNTKVNKIGNYNDEILDALPVSKKQKIAPQGGFFKGMKRIWDKVKDVYHGRNSMRKESVNHFDLFLENAVDIFQLIDDFEERIKKYITEKINVFKTKAIKGTGKTSSSFSDVGKPAQNTDVAPPREGETIFSRGTEDNEYLQGLIQSNKLTKDKIDAINSYITKKLSIKVLVPENTSNKKVELNANQFIDLLNNENKPISNDMKEVFDLIKIRIFNYFNNKPQGSAENNVINKFIKEARTGKRIQKITFDVANHFVNYLFPNYAKGISGKNKRIFALLSNFVKFDPNSFGNNADNNTEISGNNISSPATQEVSPRSDETLKNSEDILNHLEKNHKNLYNFLNNIQKDKKDVVINSLVGKTKDEAVNNLNDVIARYNNAVQSKKKGSGSATVEKPKKGSGSATVEKPKKSFPSTEIPPPSGKTKEPVSDEIPPPSGGKPSLERLKELVKDIVIPDNIKHLVSDDSYETIANEVIAGNKRFIDEEYKDEFKNYIDFVKENKDKEEGQNDEQNQNVNSGKNSSNKPENLQSIPDILNNNDNVEVIKQQLKKLEPDKEKREKKLLNYVSSVKRNSRLYDILKNDTDYREAIGELNDLFDPEDVLIISCIAYKKGVNNDGTIDKNKSINYLDKIIEDKIKSINTIDNEADEKIKGAQRNESFQNILNKFRKLIHN